MNFFFQSGLYRNNLKNRLWSLVPILLILFSGCCSQNHLYVQQERVDRSFLASSVVGTPDPRQEHPPQGQRLLIGWAFPQSDFSKHLTLVTTVRFWNEEELICSLSLTKRFGSTAYFFPNKKIVTYRVQALAEDGEVVSNWEHHFWTEWIQIGEGPSSQIAQQDKEGDEQE